MGSIRKEILPNGTIQEIHRVAVYDFQAALAGDLNVLAEEFFEKWSQSDSGKFVIANSCSKPEWHHTCMYNVVLVRFCITAELESKKLSEFYLRWGKPSGNN